MDLTILSPFLCCCLSVCVLFQHWFQEMLVPSKPISYFTIIFYLSPTCRKLRFLWLVAPVFGVGFLQVRKSLETVSKA